MYSRQILRDWQERSAKMGDDCFTYQDGFRKNHWFIALEVAVALWRWIEIFVWESMISMDIHVWSRVFSWGRGAPTASYEGLRPSISTISSGYPQISLKIRAHLDRVQGIIILRPLDMPSTMSTDKYSPLAQSALQKWHARPKQEDDHGCELHVQLAP